MKKITDYIVEKRNLMLLIFIVLAILSLFISTKVKINSDITYYLPQTSETKIGNDIMSSTFEEQKQSELNIVFKNLSEQEKNEKLQQLKIDNAIVTKESEKDNYTLYKITIEDYANSQTAKKLYNEVKKLKPYATSGNISDKNKPVVEPIVIIIAISLAVVVLIIMSNSYIEPFLYLIVIGIAIFINKGTNIIFENVSNITDSITAILQLALSMDYSIILSNRFKQEQQQEKNKIKAMKTALYESFKSITSSSITTIVGLLALAFMSFTIGKDLGFVLAKGVLLSLISIFFCLPALLLLCDNLITKTQKKSINLNLKRLGQISFKTRYISLIIIFIAFITSYMLKGNVKINYTSSEQDEVGKVFKSNNQIAIIYENKYEDLISKYCKTLEQNPKINETLCYKNTIGEKLKFTELNPKLKQLNIETNIDENLLKIIYYYYNTDENKITLNEFIKTVKEQAEQNTNLSNLEKFATIEEINKKRTPQELANLLGINIEDINNIIIYYNSKKDNKLTIKELITFMNSDDLNNYDLKPEIKQQLQQLLFFTTDNVNYKATSKELSNIFGINQETIDDLIKLHSIENNIETLGINEFAAFTLSIKENYQNLFNQETLEKLEKLEKLTNPNTMNEKYSKEKMAEILPLDNETLENLYKYYAIKHPENKMTLNEFITSTEAISKNNPEYLNEDTITKLNNLKNIIENYNQTLSKQQLAIMFNIEEEMIETETTPKNFIETILSLQKENEEIITIKKIMDNIENKFTSKEIGKILNINESITNMIYGIIEYPTIKISPNELINFIIENESEEMLLPYQNFIEEIKNIIQYNGKYSYQQMSRILNINNSTIKNIYGLYYYQKSEKTISPKEFIDTILNNQENELLKDKLTNLEKLKLLNIIITDTQKHSSKEIANILQIDNKALELIYGLYKSKTTNNISLLEITNFMVKNIINNTEYNQTIDNSSKEKLITINDIMKNIEKKYSSKELTEKLNKLSQVDPNMIELVYIYNGATKEYNNDWTLTIEQLINFICDHIIPDEKFEKYLDENIKNQASTAKNKIDESKKLLVEKNYSRVVLNTSYDSETEETFDFIKKLKSDLNQEGIYIIGDSPMALEMNETFESELNFITILTMIFIFIVVAFTFKSLIIPTILVLIIQSAVYITMFLLSIMGGNVYFIALIIVQSILMGATIDYAIVYTSYYKELRQKMDIKEAIINAYNKSIHTILTSASVLIIVTIIVAKFADAIAAKICGTISAGTLCATILIIFILPGILASLDKIICNTKQQKIH